MEAANVEIQSDRIVTAVKRRLAETLGDNLQKIILFGSRSRGEAHPDSDYDFLVLVDRFSTSLEKQVDDIAYEMLEHHGAVVTLFVDESVRFERERHEPLFCNIREEGTVV